MTKTLPRTFLLLTCLAITVVWSGPGATIAQEESEIVQCRCQSENGVVELEYPSAGGDVSGAYVTEFTAEDRSLLYDEEGSSHYYAEERTLNIGVEFTGTYSPGGSPEFSLRFSGSGTVDIDNLEDDKFDRSYEATLEGRATGNLNDDGSLTLGGLTTRSTPVRKEASEIANTVWLDPPSIALPEELTLDCEPVAAVAAAQLPLGPPIKREPPKPPQALAPAPQPPAPPPAPPPSGECGPVQVIYLDDYGIGAIQTEIDAFIEEALAQGGPDLSLVLSHRQTLMDRFGQQDFERIDGLLNDLGNIAETCPFILIVGDPDDIPFAVLPNPTDDGDVLFTDDVYGDNDHDSLGLPDIPVARIPDGQSLDLLLTQLSPSTVPGDGDFTLANTKRTHADGVATEVFGAERTLLWSLPTLHEHVDTSQVNVRQSYFMLHGGAWDTSVWWGEEDVYPDAFTVAEASSQGVVLSGACYGSYTFGRTPDNSITLSFLRSGARAFVGSTGITYSPVWTTGPNPTGPMRHDAVFHEAFLSAAARGQAPLAAFMEAKQRLAETCRLEDSTAAERKMLHEFIYFGKP